MQGVLENVKRFLANKNTVTILGVIAGVIVLYIGYNFRVKQAVEPVQIPYAQEELPSRTRIEDDKIGLIEVTSSVLKLNKGIKKTTGEVLNKFVAYGVTIPRNSFFYADTIMGANEMPSTTFTDEQVKDGYAVFSLPVDMHKTYGNSICPGNYIDLYLKGVDDEGEGDDKIIFGKFIESIKVLDVRDENGDGVFETTAENRAPTQLLFAVPENLYLLLMKSLYVEDGSLEIIPVPRNASYSNKEDDETTRVASDYIKTYVEAKTLEIEDSVVNNANNENNNNSNNNSNNNNSNNSNNNNNNNNNRNNN